MGAADEQGRFASAMRAFQRSLIVEALKQHDWKMAPTARYLGIARSHLYSLIDRHGLERPAR